MQKRWVVLKFGGTSVSSLKCWQTIASAARERLESGFRPLVVCSALAGISNELERLLSAARGGEYRDILNGIFRRHEELAGELSVSAEELDIWFKDLFRLADEFSEAPAASLKLKAEIMAHGELMSTALGTAYLKSAGIPVVWRDARDYLVSKEIQGAGQSKRFLSAVCDYEYDDGLGGRLLKDGGETVITQGFIARNGEGETVLLGRGGSDVSASYFAAMLSASRCEIWTDVPGMYTANPREVPSARLIKMLGYEEAQEIASMGAKVLHPRSIPPVKRWGIPLQIYCIGHPEVNGTLISKDGGMSRARVKAVSSKKGIILISMETVEMWHQVGFLASVFECFKRHGLSIDVVSTSETNVTVTIDESANVLSDMELKSLVRDLSLFCHVKVVEDCGIISLVGKNIRSILHQLGPALEVFEEHKVYLVSQAANDLNLTFVVDEDQVERLVARLHDQLFRHTPGKEFFGETWEEFRLKRGGITPAAEKRWWMERRDELLLLAERKSPLYVYDGKTIEDSVTRLEEIRSADGIFYALKANCREEILKAIYKRGLGFDCVSLGEMELILRLFPEIERKRIIFTPNFAPRSEYEYAVGAGVNVTLDNIYPLNAWGGLFKDKEIFVRMDPGRGMGHHKYVHTAGEKSKFGIPISQLDDLTAALKKSGARVVGLHAHVGSNIFDPSTWGETADILAAAAKKFPDVRILDIGGGLGVAERGGQNELDIAVVEEGIKASKAANPHYRLWMEPGRFIVARAGVLLARVTQVKKKGDYCYVGINAGMNSLIRPALYGAHHEIVNLTKFGGGDLITANIVGPICESGDIIGYERLIQNPDEGDILLIDTVGAYGRVMSSSYNLRQPADECFI